VQLVDRLVAMGLVKRRRSDLDRRKVIVSITAKGTGLLRRLASAHIDELLKQEPLLAESLKRLRQIARS
jgi:DNA-binding MarR family transcriptional regulator